ncbi:LOW QUALITY PROTEIN: hypothetical protein PanWU01x14_356150 [Parasponia andersonii]|uniref:Uncharacterized protein n=1 Tax=Parasponia andersonii TaxID=3476 RepID=A0A2P5A928_PARAD|nr:LOW QUALITY PROTEIN: hypothetical protein PanWU01x14_356150 [Parasponia andersonii]
MYSRLAVNNGLLILEPRTIQVFLTYFMYTIAVPLPLTFRIADG